jgi:hypothetical protein
MPRLRMGGVPPFLFASWHVQVNRKFTFFLVLAIVRLCRVRALSGIMHLFYCCLEHHSFPGGCRLSVQ